MARLRDPLDLLEPLEQLARRAGAAILEVYGRDDFAVQEKADASPLTAADLASQQVIEAGLAMLEPAVPLLTEEAAQQPWDERQGWSSFWLVDPLDGTKEFVKRNGEFTVNIALVEAGEPIVGVVYAPVLDRAYTGIVGLGAWRRDGVAAAQPIRAERPQPGASDHEVEADWVVVASRSHRNADTEAFLAGLPSHEITSMGSSLKLCLVAEGAADLYPRLAPTMEWDTGAAHAVVTAAGGRVVDLDGTPLRYNKPDLHNPRFLVLGRRSVPWREALAAATRP